MSVLQTVQSKVKTFFGSLGTSGLSGSVFQTSIPELLKPIREYSERIRARMPLVDGFNLALSQCDQIVTIGENSYAFNNIVDTILPRADESNENEYVIHGVAISDIVGQVINSLDDCPDNIKSIISAFQGAIENSDDDSELLDDEYTITVTSSSGRLYSIGFPKESTLINAGNIKMLAWMNTDIDFEELDVDIEDGKVPLIYYVPNGEVQDSGTVYLNTSVFPTGIDTFSLQGKESIKDLFIDMVKNSAILSQLQDLSAAISNNRVQSFIQTWKDKTLEAVAYGKERLSIARASVNKFMANLCEAYNYGGIKGAIQFVFAFIKAPKSWTDDNGLLTYTDNSLFVPAEYIAGAVAKVISTVTQLISTVVLMFSRAIGAVLSILGGAIYGVIQSFAADSSATRSSINPAVASDDQVAYIGMWPNAPFKGVYNIDYELGIGTWYPDWAKEFNTLVGVLCVPGGYIIFGPGSYDTTDPDNPIVTSVRWEFHASSIIWNTPWNYPEDHDYTKWSPIEQGINFDGVIFNSRPLPHVYHSRNNCCSKPAVSNFTMDGGVYDNDSHITDRMFCRAVKTDGLTASAIKQQWDYMTNDIDLIRVVGNDPTSLSIQDDCAAFYSYCANCGFFYLWVGVDHIYYPTSATSCIGLCIDGLGVAGLPNDDSYTSTVSRYISSVSINLRECGQFYGFPWIYLETNAAKLDIYYNRKFCNDYISCLTAICACWRPKISASDGYYYQDNTAVIPSTQKYNIYPHWSLVTKNETIQNDWQRIYSYTVDSVYSDTVVTNIDAKFSGVRALTDYYDIPYEYNPEAKVMMNIPSYNARTFWTYVNGLVAGVITTAVVTIAGTIGFIRWSVKKRAQNIAKFASTQAKYQSAMAGERSVYNEETHSYDTEYFDPKSLEGQRYINSCYREYRWQAFTNNCMQHIIGGSRYDVGAFWGEAESETTPQDAADSIDSYSNLINSIGNFTDTVDTYMDEDVTASSISLTTIKNLIQADVTE